MFKKRKDGYLPPIFERALIQAAKEQDLWDIKQKAEEIVPDINEQYSAFRLEDPYLLTKVRLMHAFQLSLVQPILEKFNPLNIVDIGDSSGTHLRYIIGLSKNKKNIKCMSVNLDKTAVEKIKGCGIDAICARAEDLTARGIDADVFLCFESLEHFFDPCHFLHALSTKTKAKYLVLTVPYVKNSRVGLTKFKQGFEGKFGAESTHIFELSPEDWKLIFQFSGWRVEYEKIYYQYPKRHLLRLTKFLWKKFDFEGFYGVRLVPDHKWSSKYQDW